VVKIHHAPKVIHQAAPVFHTSYVAPARHVPSLSYGVPHHK
jgi:hypothetical protein